jgi:hypothetical protein
MGRGICTVDPALAGALQISKAEPDCDGAVAWTIGAVPAAEAETGTETRSDKRLHVEVCSIDAGSRVGSVVLFPASATQ